MNTMWIFNTALHFTPALASLCIVFLNVAGCTSAVAAPMTGDGVAIVELFTSEGCSSCPPADAVLGKIVAEAKEKSLRVFPIAFHVDYWNQLGWKDRFSTPDATARQRAYGQAMKLDGIYTPQVVVNGVVECVGSNEPVSATRSGLR